MTRNCAVVQLLQHRVRLSRTNSTIESRLYHDSREPGNVTNTGSSRPG